jgi:general secretion pathway protein N
MRKWLIRLFLGLLFLIAALALVIGMTPARLLYPHVAERLQPLRLQGIDGSIWNGQASMASVLAEPLGPLSWTLDPWAALRGEASGEASLRGSSMRALGRFRLAANRLLAEAVDAQLDARLLEPALDIPALRLGGKVQARFVRLRAEDGFLREATGTLRWADLSVSGYAEAKLGHLMIHFKTLDSGEIVGELRDEGGPLRASGEIRMRDNQFRADLVLAAEPGAVHIQEALLYVGQRQQDGSSRLIIEGAMRKLF